MSLRIGILLLIITTALSSCSLDYFEQGDASSSSPEFVFFNADFTRTEDNTLSIEMSVTQLEQYSDGGYAFAKQPGFSLYDSDGKKTVIGYCDLLSADTDNDEYAFFGSVSIVSYEHDAKVEAENIRWLGKNEIFEGTIDESVTISIGNQQSGSGSDEKEKKTELTVVGTGFSASGIDFSYSFSGPVTGRIIEN